MALRFKKSIKLAPGIRWNISGSGSSWTIGPRGASVGIGKRGAFLNSGIPGTGVYSRSNLSGSSTARENRATPLTTTVSMTCAILDDGSLSFTDKSGAQVPEHVVETAKKQNREAILSLIQRKCDEINEQIEALGRLHQDTSDPRKPLTFVAPTFPKVRPTVPIVKVAGFFESLLPGRRQKIEDFNRTAETNFRNAITDWENEKRQFDQQVSERKLLLESLIYKDNAAMERFLEENLEDIAWPRETVIAFDISEGGKSVALDVDLPEIEDMPSRLAAVPARGLKLSVKEIGTAKLQKLYAAHIHGVLFRLIGEVFFSLPNTQVVTIAGYSQRREPSTAQLRDAYLLSVRVDRTDWCKIDFAHLASLDPAHALSQFDIRRDMSKLGVLKAITPHTGVT